VRAAVLSWLVIAAVILIPVAIAIWGDEDLEDNGIYHEQEDEPRDPDVLLAA
jgi:hypothetical protein